jgi:hypothetical protein
MKFFVEFIAATRAELNSAIVDIGGGASRLLMHY